MVDKRLVFHFLLIFVLLIFASVLYSLSDVYGRLKFQSNYTVQIQINRHHNNVGQTETWQANSTYCGNVTMPSRGLRERQKWVEVIQDTVFAFSAHYDDVSELPAVRIVGAKVFQEIEKMACRLWFPSEEFYHRVLVVEAEVRHLPKYLRRKYKFVSTIFICRVPVRDKPYAVSLVRSDCENATNIFPVISQIDKRRQFTVCVSPLHSQYGMAFQLIEFLEFNLLLGVNKFIIYTYSTSFNVDKVIQWYVDANLARVIRWDLPVNFSIMYYAQRSALNDCLYRNLHASRFLVNVDVDEFIIPRNANDWIGLINEIDPESSACGYYFKHTRFGLEWNDTDDDYSEKNLAQKYRSITLLKLVRENLISKIPVRSKYIVNPLRADMLGIHTISSTRPGCEVLTISGNSALLHHYRGYVHGRNGVPHPIVDSTMLKFKDRLLQRLTEAWSRFKNIPMNIDD